MKRIRRTTIVSALSAAALMGGLALAPTAQAAPVAETPSVDMQARGAWACLAVRGVNVGFCLDNPLPSLGR